jgi:predicted small secreted protein
MHAAPAPPTPTKEPAMPRRPTAALLAPALLIGLLGLSACNTMEGLGRDMEKAGQEIEEEAAE